MDNLYADYAERFCMHIMFEDNVQEWVNTFIKNRFPAFNPDAFRRAIVGEMQKRKWIDSKQRLYQGYVTRACIQFGKAFPGHRLDVTPVADPDANRREETRNAVNNMWGYSAPSGPAHVELAALAKGMLERMTRWGL